MTLFTKLGFAADAAPAIDWDLLPEETFAIFESWGGRERIRNKRERFYYFFIDNWQKPAALCLMERGIKHARVLARIKAPQELIDRAVSSQGKSIGLDKNYGIDGSLRKWLQEHVVDSGDDSRVIPLAAQGEKAEVIKLDLPALNDALPEVERITLPRSEGEISDERMVEIVTAANFYDNRTNPEGSFPNALVDTGDGLTVIDRRTGLMWQRGGSNITSIRKIAEYVRQLNESNFAGHSDWRLPAMEEALSLMNPERNGYDQHLHGCFSAEQPFVFLAGRRTPGGYWFCDFKQGTLFWASGTIPGGFGRVCRQVS